MTLLQNQTPNRARIKITLSALIFISIILYSIFKHEKELKSNFILVGLGFVILTMLSYLFKYKNLSRTLFLINSALIVFAGAAYLNNYIVHQMYPNSGLYVDEDGLVQGGVMSYDFIGDLFVGTITTLLIIVPYAFLVRTNKKLEQSILASITICMIYFLSIAKY